MVGPGSKNIRNIPYSALGFVIYIINIILIIHYNPFKIYTDHYKFTIFLFALAGFFNLLLYAFLDLNQKNSSKTFLDFLYQVGYRICFLLFFYFLIYGFFYYIVFNGWSLNITTTIFNIIGVIGILAFIYNYFIKDLDSGLKSKFDSNSKTVLIVEWLKYAIFYIPCLLLDFIDFVKKQYKITTNTTWIILAIEAIVIGLRISIPYLYQLYHKTGGSIIEKGPLYLNTEKDLGVFQNKPTDSKIKIQEFNYNYAISCWIWINPQPGSTSDAYNKSTTLLNYGDVLKISFNKNKLEFIASTTESANKLTFGENKQVLIYETTTFPYQKWNNIVFNYDGGTLDIFINNSLVSSVPNITPVMYYNKVTSGETNGINGGIKDLIYYNKVLSKNDIYSIYAMG